MSSIPGRSIGVRAYHRGNIIASHTAPGLILSVPDIVDVAEVNQQRWLEKSGQWLENADQTFLVLASDKPVVQKESFMYQETSTNLSIEIWMKPVTNLVLQFPDLGLQ